MPSVLSLSVTDTQSAREAQAFAFVPGTVTSAQKDHLVLFIQKTTIGHLQYARLYTEAGAPGPRFYECR